MTVRDFFSTILSSKKIEQFNNLKADVLAWRFYRVREVGIDESDYINLFEGMDYHKSKFSQALACLHLAVTFVPRTPASRPGGPGLAVRTGRETAGTGGG